VPLLIMAVNLWKRTDIMCFRGGNAANNWQEVVKQLHWFMNGKADTGKIGTILELLMQARKFTRLL